MKRILLLLVLLAGNSVYSQKWKWADKISLNGQGNNYGLAIATDKDNNVVVTGRVKGAATFGTGPNAVSPPVFGDRDAYISKYDQAGNFLWAKRYGGIDSDYGYGIGTDKNSNIYLTGIVVGPAYFGKDTVKTTLLGDVYLAKVSPSGDLLWVRTWGGAENDLANGIAVDAEGNSYIAGVFYGKAVFGKDTLVSAGVNDIFVAKIDTDGNCIWARGAGDTGNEDARSIVINKAGTNIYVGGYFQKKLAFGDVSATSFGSNDIFLAKFNSDGKALWLKNAGSSNNEYIDAISVDALENIYVTGNYLVTLNFGTNTKPILIDPPTGGQASFLAKYDSTGTVKWAKRAAAGTLSVYADGLCTNKFNNPVICGYFEATTVFDGQPHTVEGDSHDGFITEYDSNGSIVWFRQFKGIVRNGVFAGAKAVITDEKDNTYVTGGFLDTVHFDSIRLVAGGYTTAVLIGKLSPFVKANFTTSQQEICMGDSIVFTDISRGFPSSWKWLFQGADVSTSTETNPVVKYSNDGIFDVTLIIDNGTEQDTLYLPDYIKVKNCTTVGVPDENDNQTIVTVHPNPFSDIAELMVTGLQSHEGVFKLYNYLGQCVQQAQLKNNQSLQIERKNLPAGIYNYAISDGNKFVKTGKIVIY